MKIRIVALFVTLVLIIQSNFNCIVSGEEVENYAAYVTSESFLKALNIVSDGEDYTLTVTRGDAASYLAVMLGEKSNYLEYRGIFADVDSSNSNALAIEKLADLGIVRGDGNLSFRPDDNLTYNEATVMLMNVLGYGLIGTSAAYNEAKRAGILDGIKAEFDVVNLGDLYVMMYNTLMAEPIVQTVYGKNSEYEKSQQSLLYKVYSVVYAEGVIVKNDLTYLWSAKEEPDNFIEIKAEDGSVSINAEEAMAQVRDDLGKRVKVYYYEDSESGINKYVHHELKASNKVVRIFLNQIDMHETDFSSGMFAYYKKGNNKSTTLSLASDYNIIYNNVAYKSNTVKLDEITDKAGYVEIIDSNSDGSYETVIIKAYDTIVAGNISISNNFIYDKYDIKKKIDIDEKNYEKVYIYDASGTEALLEDITAGNVLSYAISDAYDGIKIIEIHISNDIRNGKITQYKKGEFTPYIIVDGNEELCLYDRAAKEKYSVNSNIIAYLDVFGNVIFISDDKTRDMDYGIITALDSGEDGSLNGEIKVKLITTSGEVIETKLDAKPIIDGESYSGKLDSAYKTLSAIKMDNISFASGLTFNSDIIPVRYQINEEGYIKIIDTVKIGKGANDGLRRIGYGTYIGVSGSILGYKIPYYTDAVLLQIAAPNLNDIDSFNQKKNITSKIVSNTFKSGIVYDVVAYTSDENSEHAEFIISFDGSGMTLDTEFFVVDEFMEGYNKNRDEKMSQITGFKNGSYTEYWIDNSIDLEADGIKKGDIIRCVTDKDDCIVKYEKIFIRTKDGSTFSQGDGMKLIDVDSTLSLGTVCGYVYSRTGELIKTSNVTAFGAVPKLNSLIEAGSTEWKPGDDELFYTNTGTSAIVVVDDTEDDVYVGDVGDISDYETMKDECSLVVMRWRSNSVKEIVVYK